MLTKALPVEWAARIHRVPFKKFLDTLNKAIAAVEQDETPDSHKEIS
jgi:hypothetical protein